jgi:hypothetical protein
MHAFMMRMEKKINEQAQEINKMECSIHEQNAKILNLNSHMKMLEDNLMLIASHDLSRTHTDEASRGYIGETSRGETSRGETSRGYTSRGETSRGYTGETSRGFTGESSRSSRF